VVAQTRRAWAADAPQEEIDSEFHAIVTDWAGTPTELLSPDGRIDWRAETSVWGAPLAGASDGLDTRFPLGFPGQYHDSETGLDYNYLRYYDPEAARYVTPDPLGLFPQPDNYGYTSNPLIWTDPLGLAPHHATITVYDQHGQVKYGPYGMVSGHTVPEEKALGFPNSNMATHTEARAMRMHGGSPTVPIPGDPYANSHPVAPGDHIVIDGEKPPCPQCKGAMNRALRETGANVTYNWGGNAWHAS
jgi:RHS repeat-associated protein